MHLTVSKLINIPSFAGLKLIAGADGLSRTISKPGILDYEYDPRVTKRYIDINFHPGQFVLTTFLYAVNNEYLIFDAVKNLVSRGASGLVIKNIFSISIPQNAINYANSNNFPIFILNETTVYFEDLILDIYKAIDNIERSSGAEKIIDTILESSENTSLVKKNARKLNPSLCSNFFTVYLDFKDSLCDGDYDYVKLFGKLRTSDILSDTGVYLKYHSGILIVISMPVLPSFENKQQFTDFTQNLLYSLPIEYDDFYVGISRAHFDLTEFAISVNECMCAEQICRKQNDTFKHFDSTGVYQIVLPLRNNIWFNSFAMSFINPILEYDMQSHTSFLPTIISFIECNGDIPATASYMNQHENTIRYRLKKLNDIFSIDYQNKEDYALLSLAVKIYNSKTMV